MKRTLLLMSVILASISAWAYNVEDDKNYQADYAQLQKLKLQHQHIVGVCEKAQAFFDEKYNFPAGDLSNLASWGYSDEYLNALETMLAAAASAASESTPYATPDDYDITLRKARFGIDDDAMGVGRTLMEIYAHIYMDNAWSVIQSIDETIREEYREYSERILAALNDPEQLSDNPSPQFPVYNDEIMRQVEEAIMRLMDESYSVLGSVMMDGGGLESIDDVANECYEETGVPAALKYFQQKSGDLYRQLQEEDRKTLEGYQFYLRNTAFNLPDVLDNFDKNYAFFDYKQYCREDEVEEYSWMADGENLWKAEAKPIVEEIFKVSLEGVETDRQIRMAIEEGQNIPVAIHIEALRPFVERMDYLYDVSLYQYQHGRVDFSQTLMYMFGSKHLMDDYFGKLTEPEAVATAEKLRSDYQTYETELKYYTQHWQEYPWHANPDIAIYYSLIFNSLYYSSIRLLESTDIPSVATDGNAHGKTYDLQGREASGSYKGIVIRNGKKFLQK